MCWHGEPSRIGMPEHDMAGPMLIVIDAQTVRDNLEVLNSPVAWIAAHLATSFLAFDTTIWYHPRYHLDPRAADKKLDSSMLKSLPGPE